MKEKEGVVLYCEYIGGSSEKSIPMERIPRYHRAGRCFGQFRGRAVVFQSYGIWKICPFWGSSSGRCSLSLYVGRCGRRYDGLPSPLPDFNSGAVSDLCAGWCGHPPGTSVRLLRPSAGHFMTYTVSAGINLPALWQPWVLCWQPAAPWS